MAKEKSNIRSVATGQTVIVRKDHARGSKVRFGSVLISGAKPSREAVEGNIERSTKALERVMKKLVKPGVALRAKKDVPQFSVAEDEAGVFIRRLNGRVERGRLVNGAFQVID